MTKYVILMHLVWRNEAFNDSLGTPTIVQIQILSFKMQKRSINFGNTHYILLFIVKLCPVLLGMHIK